jgi:protoheme IX farnesyltransferase
VANTEVILSTAQTKTHALGRARPRSGEKARAAALPFARDLIALTKPRITLLVLATEAAGAYLAPGHAGARAECAAMVGTALIVGSANTLNMWWERDIDALMARTRSRPLPAGRLSPDVALGFGIALAAVSVPMLFMVNVATALLGLAALLIYVAVYTPLKPHTHLALLVGAVPGAIPPLLGWATVTGTVGLGGMLLFGVLFLWQIPHFAAITIFRAEDYRRAGLKVVSVQHGERAARQTIALYTFLLALASLLFVPFGLSGEYYPIAATGLGAVFLALAFRGLRGGARFESTPWAKRVFAFSVLYLPALLIALLVHRSPG